MGYVFDYNDSIAYAKWCAETKGCAMLEQQTELLTSMLDIQSRDSVLDIGCGTGYTLQKLIQWKQVDASGLDASPYMLDIAEKRLGHKATLQKGVSEELPFDDNAFHHAFLISTLEFVSDPAKSIEEAARVAKDRLFICVNNRYAIEGFEKRLKGDFSETLYKNVRIFSIWELKHMVREIVGKVPVQWKSVNYVHEGNGFITSRLIKSGLIQKIPIGSFMVLSITLKPRYWTTPITLKVKKSKRGGLVGVGQYKTKDDVNCLKHAE